MKKKKSKWRGFILFMVIYAVLVLAAGAVGMTFLWGAADTYEKNLPYNKMEAYVHGLDRYAVDALVERFSLRGVDHNIQKEKDVKDAVWEDFKFGVDYRKLTSDKDGNRITYQISNDHRDLGTVTIEREDSEKAIRPWNIVKEDYDFSYLLNETSFVIPDTWTATCNGVTLDSSYVADDTLQYPFLEEFYEKDVPLPHMYRYEVKNFVGDVDIEFRDSNGRKVTMPEETDGKELVSRADEEMTEKVNVFVDKFVPLYVECLANVNHNMAFNLFNIGPYLVPGGDIDQRLNASVVSQNFTQSRATQIDRVEIGDIFDVGDGNCIVDLSYTVTTLSLKGTTVSDTNMYLYLMDDGDSFRALTMSLY